MAFDGACQGKEIEGTLRLHGDSHPFHLDVTRSKAAVTAEGRLQRAEWGITARPLAVGPTIRIRVELPNPMNGPHA
jgi:polyisoprenoid-binding protein YceI